MTRGRSTISISVLTASSPSPRAIFRPSTSAAKYRRCRWRTARAASSTSVSVQRETLFMSWSHVTSSP